MATVFSGHWKWSLILVVVMPMAGATPRSAEMPELSGPGPLSVGTDYREWSNGDRKIGVRLWYPAEPNSAMPAVVYKHRRALPGQRALDLEERGLAREKSAPKSNERFPLVLMSHGYGGWAEHMSQLGETLASRGYIVCSIDHRDLPFDDARSFALSFGSVLINRAVDQQRILTAFIDQAIFERPVTDQIDLESIALLGFSMGGYGSLITAGVPLDRGAPAYAQFPSFARAMLPDPDPAIGKRIKAVVALAPWGGQPGAMVWSDTALTTLKAPLLLIDGDQDDVVDFKLGVKRLFQAVSGTERYLLVYREAAHNIAGNPMLVPDDADFPTIEFTTDPVWRKERIQAINEHFISAFLDLHLKGDTYKRNYLKVPTPYANDGQWPSVFGQQWGGMRAGDSQPDYWRGFQRRWARGLELHHKAAGK